ncbi:MAG: acyl-CoA dehydratase activase-related protein [Actinomycetota bacterium]|nr:acyl-CoA dehydratase activase-related protein [Actinomycetota bacterium]MDI6822691.1 acyl-CoA dehydratase activase-related protein [Actinomycetota bacterium]
MAFKIGVPQALLYYKYFPLWKTFFDELNCQVVVSNATNKRILNAGLKVAENELCLPVKSFFGHVLDLVDEVDFLFIPRLVSVDTDGYTCPKLLGLPDMVENTLRELKGREGFDILCSSVDLKEKRPWPLFFEQLGEKLGHAPSRIFEASKKAQKAQEQFHSLLMRGYLPTEIFTGGGRKGSQGYLPTPTRRGGRAGRLTIGIAGHCYLIYDPHISMNIVKKIQDTGACILTPEMVPDFEIKKSLSALPKPLFWNYQKRIFGAVWHWCQNGLVDGIIHLPAFPCGPDSVMGEFIEHEAKEAGIPLSSISIDEHAGEAGVRTRIEAFMDMIQWKKGPNTKSFSVEKAVDKPLGSERIRIPRKERVVSFPRMGEDTHLVLKYLFERLGTSCIIPPPTTERTLKLGVKYAPETICLPLKVNLGNYIEVLEKGANVLVHAGGCGPCRFGYYGALAELILRELGYKFEFKILEPPGSQGLQTFADFFRFFSPGKVSPIFLPLLKSIICGVASLSGRAWVELLALTPHDRTLWRIIKASFLKKRAFDIVEKRALETRCYEARKGETTKALKKARHFIDQAQTLEEMEEAKEEGLKLLSAVDIDSARDVLRVGLVGEFFILLEPFINFDIERFLGEEGIYIERGVYASDWIAPTRENVVGGTPYEDLVEAAHPYLKHRVGGEGLPTVGHTAILAEHGFDGVIHMMPFTCMPETVAKQILPVVSREQNIPILSLVIDEQTGKAGIQTRLEAFIDLMRNRRELIKRR